MTVLLFRLSDLITFKQKRCTDLIFYNKQIFFCYYHSFFQVLKHRKHLQFWNLYNHTRVLAVNADQVSPLPVVVVVFLFWLVIFFGLALSLKLQIELSGIHWSRKVSYLKSWVSHWSEEKLQRTMEIVINLYARPDEHLIMLLTKNWVNIATSYSISYPFCRCWSIHAQQ